MPDVRISELEEALAEIAHIVTTQPLCTASWLDIQAWVRKHRELIEALTVPEWR